MSKILQNLAVTRKRASEADSPAELSDRSQKKIKLLTKPEVQVAPSKKKSKKSGSVPSDGSSVVYLGHIPHGFYEQELRKFFSQFGKLEKLKLVRSKKTGGSRGHAFLKFETSEIAEVVASAIDGYFLQERQLVCHIVPQNKIHSGLFALPKRKSQKGTGEETDTEGNDEAETMPEPEALTEKKLAKVTRFQTRKQSRLQELGIEFNFLSAK
jgi:nucleolar protein 15